LGFGVGEEGDLFLDEGSGEVVIAVDVGDELVEPGFALSEGGVGGDDTEGIDVGGVAGGGDALDVGGVFGVDPTAFEGGEVKGLAGGFEDDAIVDDFAIVEAGEGGVLAAFVDEVAVDFVDEEDDAAPGAEFADGGEFVVGPGVAGGVIGIAEDEGMGVVGDVAVEGFEVEEVAAVGLFERDLLGEAVGGGDVAEEAVVGGGEEEDFAAGGGEGAEGADDAGVDAVGEQESIGGDGDAVAALVPIEDGLAEAIGDGEVAPILVLEAFLQGGGDDGGGTEVGIGDAHAGDDGVFAVAADLGVPFGGIGADAVVGGVEVEAVGGEQGEGGGGKEVAAAEGHGADY